MDKTTLETELQEVLNKTKVFQLAVSVSKNIFTLKNVIDLTFNTNVQVGFRAAWVLEEVYFSYPEVFLPDLYLFLDSYHLQNNLSARRHYAKILASLTKKNKTVKFKNALDNYDTALLVETNFAWLIDTQVPVATKSHCLNVLANFAGKHGWIKDELLQTMDYLVNKESIGFYAKVKQIKKQLK